MELCLYHLYPDLMSLYGSYANLSVLCRLLGRLGHTVTVVPVALGAKADLTEADLLYMGAGTERARDAALSDILRFREPLRAAFANGVPMLFVGTALELCGRELIGPDGDRREGLGLADFTVTEGRRRIVGDVLADTALYDGPVVGYMNKCTILTGVTAPLLTACRMGFGNAAAGDAEGWHENRAFGSELTGPLLVKNPGMLHAVAGAILAYRELSLPDEWPDDGYALQGYAVTADQLQKRLTDD